MDYGFQCGVKNFKIPQKGQNFDFQNYRVEKFNEIKKTHTRILFSLLNVELIY